MHRIAPEIPQKVSVLFENQDGDAGPGQEKAQHHAGRTAAGDAAAHCDLARFHRSPRRAVVSPPHPPRPSSEEEWGQRLTWVATREDERSAEGI